MKTIRETIRDQIERLRADGLTLLLDDQGNIQCGPARLLTEGHCAFIQSHMAQIIEELQRPLQRPRLVKCEQCRNLGRMGKAVACARTSEVFLILEGGTPYGIGLPRSCDHFIYDQQKKGLS